MHPFRLKNPLPLIALLCAGPMMAIAATVPPQLLKPVEPVHPEQLAFDGVDGTATLSMKINTDGTVSDVKMVNATRTEFGRAAKEAAEQWEFKPAMKDGEAVAVRVIQEFNFTAPIERWLARIAGREVVVEQPEPLLAWDDLDEKPRLTRSPRRMPYPADFKGTGVTADVEINFIINKDGDVINPVVINSTEPSFNTSALEALLGHRWRSPKNGREPVYVAHSIDIRIEER